MTVAIRVDGADPTPAFEQIRLQLAGAVAAGTLAPGTRLPTVRQLAADLGVAPGTVMRAYSELETAGFVTTRRGLGTVVAHVPTGTGGVRIAGAADRFVADAAAAGATPDDMRAALEAALSRRPR